MKNKKLYVVCCLLIVAFVISIVDKTFQNDTFFTIPIGQYILENGITDEEQFTWHEGLTFTNSRWIFDVIIAGVYNNFGFTGIYIFILFISSLIGLTLFNVLIDQKNNMLLSFIATLIVLLFSQEALTGRAQIMSYLFIILEVFFIERLANRKEKKYIVFLLIDSILIANFHASVWPMFFIFFLPYFAEAIIIKFKMIKTSDKIIFEKDDVKLLIVTFIVALFTGLCTPNRFVPYTNAIKTLMGNTKSFIQEMQPVIVIQNLSMIVCLGADFLILFFNKTKIRLKDLFMIAGLLIWALMVNRNLPIFFFIAVMPYCRTMTNLFNEVNNSETINEVTDSINKNCILLIICILTICICNYTSKINQKYDDNEIYPVEAVDYILNNVDIDNMRIYNGFNYGSYLEFKGIKVFMDSRAEMYCKEFNDTEIMDDYIKLSGGKITYSEIFEKYGITHALLYKGETIDVYMRNDENYTILYEDDYYVLYEKN